jgi:ATP-dependent protease ClpP protease subunit
MRSMKKGNELKKSSKSEESDDTDTMTDIYLEDNHIYFYSDIDRSSISRLTSLLREAEEYCILTSNRLRIDPIPIYLHIYSNGGYINSAFAAIDAIESCKVHVYSVIEGATASAGTMISVICKKRYIRPRAHMLIHQLSGGCLGKMSEINDEYHNLIDSSKKIKELYLQYTRIPSKKLEQLLNRDLWLDSKQSISMGLADELYK